MSDSEEESSDIEITPRTWESEESGASLPADGSTPEWYEDYAKPNVKCSVYLAVTFF